MSIWYRISIVPHHTIERPFETAKQALRGSLDGQEQRLVIIGGRETVFAIDTKNRQHAEFIKQRLQTYYPGSQTSIKQIDDAQSGLVHWVDVHGVGPMQSLLPPWPDEREKATVMNDLMLGLFPSLHSEEADWHTETQIVLKAAPEHWAKGLAQDADSQSVQNLRAIEREEERTDFFWIAPLIFTLVLIVGPVWIAERHLTLTQRATQMHSIRYDLSHLTMQWDPWKPLLPTLIMGIILWILGVVLWHWMRNRRIVIPDMKRLQEKTQQPAYRVGIRCVSNGAETTLNALAGGYAAMSVPHGVKFQRGKAQSGEHGQKGSPIQWGRGRILGIDELVMLWHIPSGEEGGLVQGIRYSVSARARSAPQELRNVPNAWAIGTVPGEEPEVAITLLPQHFRDHMLLAAKTGEGKSTLMAHLFIRALEATETGGLLIDPHGDLVENLLPLFSEEQARRVKLIDLSDKERIFAFNALDMRYVRDIGVHAGRLASMFAVYFQEGWGQRMEEIFVAAVKTLLAVNKYMVEEGQPETQWTLRDVPPLLTDPNFLEESLRCVTDSALLKWWDRTFKPMRDDPRSQAMFIQAITPVNNRLEQFTRTDFGATMIGQPTLGIDAREIVATNGICLVKGSNTNLGEATNQLLLTILIGLFEQAFADQGQLSEPERKKCLVIIDEFQSLSGVSYKRLLGELRKFGPTCVLATQTLAYVRSVKEGLLSTVFGNVKTIFAYGVSAEDAKLLSPECDDISVQELVNQDRYSCYVKTSMGERKLPIFSMRTRPVPRGNPDQEIAIRAKWHAMSLTYEQAKAQSDALAKRQAIQHSRKWKGLPDVAIFKPGPIEPIQYPGPENRDAPAQSADMTDQAAAAQDGEQSQDIDEGVTRQSQEAIGDEFDPLDDLDQGGI